MIFKLLSNHHGISYTVCRSVLGIQRDYFRPEITFLTTSGQMADHILKNKKSQKSPKNRFGPKIQMPVEWPIFAGMMICGRKWVLKVFQNRCAPKIIILSIIDHILNNFQKIDFFDFLFVGPPKMGPVEYSMGLEISI